MKVTLVLLALLLFFHPSVGFEDSTRQQDTISYGSPAWSPDGASIAFTSDRSGNRDIWVMTSDGKTLTNLTEQNLFTDFSPEWSPDGKSIAYVAEFISDFGPILDIWLVRVDDGSRTNLTAPLLPSGGIVWNDDSAWSPDGTQIVFHSDTKSATEIVVFNTRDSTFTTLMQRDNGYLYQPAWSPDGELIAFTAYGDNPGLWVTTKEGDDLREITSGTVRDFSWSPDGTRIVFTSILDSSYENGDIDLMIVDLDSLEVVNVTDVFPGAEVEAAWSPTEEEILFRGSVDGVSDIWKINEDGSDPVNLTSDDATDSTPVWSPDGSRIMFLSDRAGAYDIWVMEADGSEPVNLTG